MLRRLGMPSSLLHTPARVRVRGRRDLNPNPNTRNPNPNANANANPKPNPTRLRRRRDPNQSAEYLKETERRRAESSQVRVSGLACQGES